jgi:flagellar biosynthesis protein FlhB
MGKFVAHMRGAMVGATQGRSLGSAGLAGLELAVFALAMPLAFALAGALLVGALQTRGLFAMNALRFEPKRILPSLRQSCGGTCLLGVVGVGWVGTVTIWSQLSAIGRLSGAGAFRTLHLLGRASETLALRMGIALFFVGALDYFHQVHRLRKRLRMSQDEVRREQRELEGDARFKAERQRLYLAHSKANVAERVCDAAFVVVDGNAFAVAILYDPNVGEPPSVLLKGRFLQAERIKDRAREASIPIFLDARLVLVLRDVEEGAEIPLTCYEPVAEWMIRVPLGPRHQGET